MNRGAGDVEDGVPFSIPRPSVSVLAHDPLLASALTFRLEQVGFALDDPPTADGSIGFSPHVSVCVPPVSARAFADDGWHARMLERAELAALVVVARGHLPVFELVEQVRPTRGVVVLDGDDAASFERLDSVVWFAAAGQRFVDPGFASTMRPDGVLSPAEQRVYDELAAGASNNGIAEALYISQRTVEVHVRRIFSKLGIANDPKVNRRVVAALRHEQ